MKSFSIVSGNRRSGNCLWLVPFLVMVGGMGNGCTGERTSGPVRYGLQGKVTWQGKPVPAGEILFTPDNTAGNTGPGSLAMIQDGKFSLGKDQGIVGGAYHLEVSGNAGDSGNDESGEPLPPKKLFSNYELRVQLPAEGGTFDISLPLQR